MTLFLTLISLVASSAHAGLFKSNCYPINEITAEMRAKSPDSFDADWGYTYQNSGWSLFFNNFINSGTDSGPEESTNFKFEVDSNSEKGIRTRIVADYRKDYTLEVSVPDGAKINVEGHKKYLSYYKLTTKAGAPVNKMTLACDLSIADIDHL